MLKISIGHIDVIPCSGFFPILINRNLNEDALVCEIKLIHELWQSLIPSDFKNRKVVYVINEVMLKDSP